MLDKSRTINQLLNDIEQEQAQKFDAYDPVEINRDYYVESLLINGYQPTERLINLYRFWMTGTKSDWWYKACLPFDDFLETYEHAVLMVKAVKERLGWYC